MFDPEKDDFPAQATLLLRLSPELDRRKRLTLIVTTRCAQEEKRLRKSASSNQ